MAALITNYELRITNNRAPPLAAWGLMNMGDESLTAALRNLLDESVAPNSEICVGYSGGMDSAVLLHAAASLRPRWRISACHVVDNAYDAAPVWEAFCRRVCGEMGVSLRVRRAGLGGDVSEDAARQIRLTEFGQVGADAVLLAHHADDQAETALFRFLRGAGAHGLAAMRERAEVRGAVLLRPWLAFGRGAIRAYAVAHRLRWIEDHDNRNLARRRNVLRWRTMPSLAADFGCSVATLAANAGRMRDASELLMQLGQADGAAARASSGGSAMTADSSGGVSSGEVAADVEARAGSGCAPVADVEGGVSSGGEVGYSLVYLRSLGELRVQNWLYSGLCERGVSVSERHIVEAARQIVRARDDRRLRLNFGSIKLTQRGQNLHWA